jgi:lipid II:glycine glycyltransferase (peptidoglycan interpeptide bridge formation enzyme)
MNLSIDINITKEAWENAVSQFSEANFLQSWNWGEFQKALGKTVFRIYCTKNNVVVALAQLVIEHAKRGNYITIAGGPIMDWENKEVVNFVFDKIKSISKEQKVDFIRFRPQVLVSDKLERVMVGIGAKLSQMHLTADLTLQLDLRLSEDELLSQMRKNHRSSIRKCDKLGITVKQTSDPQEIKSFYDSQLALAQKHGFVPFGYNFLHEQFKAFSADNQVLLFHSYHEGKLLASAFIIFYNGEAVYHYGISTDENRKLPGSYACQWAAIKEAKVRNCTKYNFWGIAPETAKGHRFAGVTMFKTGFGGEHIEYVHAHDVPMSFKYHLIAGFEFVRKKLRRL